MSEESRRRLVRVLIAEADGWRVPQESVVDRVMEGLEPLVAAAVVIGAQGVLMIRRRVPEGPLLWHFPAGKIEPGESAVDAAVRETDEETGLDVVAGGILGSRVHPQSGWPMVYVACALLDGTPRPVNPLEVAEVAWVRLAEIPAYVPDGVFPPVQAYLDKVLGGAGGE